MLKDVELSEICWITGAFQHQTIRRRLQLLSASSLTFLDPKTSFFGFKDVYTKCSCSTQSRIVSVSDESWLHAQRKTYFKDINIKSLRRDTDWQSEDLLLLLSVSILHRFYITSQTKIQAFVCSRWHTTVQFWIRFYFCFVSRDWVSRFKWALQSSAVRW